MGIKFNRRDFIKLSGLGLAVAAGSRYFRSDRERAPDALEAADMKELSEFYLATYDLMQTFGPNHFVYGQCIKLVKMR